MALAKVTRISSTNRILNCTGSNEMRMLGSFLFRETCELTTYPRHVLANATHAWYIGTSKFFSAVVFDSELQDAHFWKESEPFATVIDIGV